MGVQLVCDACKRPVLSAIPTISGQTPTAISGAICLRCLRERMDRLEVKNVEDE
jgi:hypothetical protein